MTEQVNSRDSKVGAGPGTILGRERGVVLGRGNAKAGDDDEVEVVTGRPLDQRGPQRLNKAPRLAMFSCSSQGQREEKLDVLLFIGIGERKHLLPLACRQGVATLHPVQSGECTMALAQGHSSAVPPWLAINDRSELADCLFQQALGVSTRGGVVREKNAPVEERKAQGERGLVPFRLKAQGVLKQLAALCVELWNFLLVLCLLKHDGQSLKALSHRDPKGCVGGGMGTLDQIPAQKNGFAER